MRRILLYLVVLLLACTTVWAQTTAPSSASFDIEKSGAGEGTGINVYSPTGYMQWEDKTGNFINTPLYYVGLDSIEAQQWTGEITKAIDTLAHKYEVRIQGFSLANRSRSLTYIDTLDRVLCTKGFYFPDRERDLQNGQGLNALLPRDSTFAVSMKAGVHRVGDKFSIRVDNYFRARGYNDGSLKVTNIEYPHQKIHLGKHYMVWYDSTLASANDSIKIVFIPPASGEVHLRFDTDATAKTFFAVREGVTVTSGDTMTVRNNRRGSSNTSGAVVMKRCVITAPNQGTILFPATLGASGAGKVGGSTRSEEEIVLSSTKKYLFVWAVTAAAVVNVRFYFYIE